MGRQIKHSPEHPYISLKNFSSDPVLDDFYRTQCARNYVVWLRGKPISEVAPFYEERYPFQPFYHHAHRRNPIRHHSR